VSERASERDGHRYVFYFLFVCLCLWECAVNTGNGEFVDGSVSLTLALVSLTLSHSLVSLSHPHPPSL